MECAAEQIEDVGHTFSREYTEFGVTVTIDLIPNGRNIDVTLENRQEFLRLYIEEFFCR
jgi:hypothetical protein